MVNVLLGSLVFLLLLAACATTGVGGLDAALQRAGTDAERGKLLYEDSCDRCHGLYMPSSYTPGEWRLYVRKYGRRARLSKDERSLVFLYLEQQALEAYRLESVRGTSSGGSDHAVRDRKGAEPSSR